MQPAARSGGGANGGGGGASLESGGNHHHHHHHQQKYFSGVGLRITLVLAVVAITCLVLNQSSYPIDLFRNSNSFSTSKPSKISSLLSCHTSNSSSSSHHQFSLNLGKEENMELERTLRKAAMKDKRTVIITTLNAAWAEPNSIFDLFLESFRVGNGTEELLNHVVVGAFDRAAYERCTAEGLHCYAVKTEGVDFSGEAAFMSEDYLKMMWRRIDFLRTVLDLGYDFVFTDADVMWLRDPFPRFYPDGDFQIACDHFWANYTDPENSPNGGFNYVKSNNRTVEFYKFWYNGRLYFPGKHDQDVLNMIKFNPFITSIGLEMRFFDTAEFGGFCEPRKDMDRAVTMHANCCIGIENKIHDLKLVIDDWKRYASILSGDGNGNGNLTSTSWTMPRYCG